MFDFLKTGFQKVKRALTKTHAAFTGKLKVLFTNPLDESTYQQLEQILYEADLGSGCTEEFVEKVRAFLKKEPEASFEKILECMQSHALSLLCATDTPRTYPPPLVMLIVGINGSGKTTSVAKLAHLFKEQGKKVLVAAADTFRAAAIEQLTLWAEKLDIDIVKGTPQSDPSAVVFDALSAAKARGTDVVLIDTAGRLQNKTALMHELEKIKKTCRKLIPEAPQETLLVLDATTGQNGVDQARVFHQFTPLSGIILTKLDGSAKGGVILSIYKELSIPVRWVGLGEKAEDFIPFEPASYVQALFDID